MPALKRHAADLRTKYHRYLKISLIFTLFFLIAAFKFSPKRSDTELSVIITDTPIIEVVDIPETIQRPKPPPPENPILIEPNEEDFEEIVFNETIWSEHDVVNDPLPPSAPPSILEETIIFKWSEVMPEPVGGLASIQNKITYTEIAKRIKLEGKVYIEAVVDENGNVIESRIIKKIGGGLDEEALIAVTSTKFHPGLQRGKPVKVRITIPIKFVLK